MKILIPAILDNYSPRKDNSFSIKFVTQELSNEQLLNINAARDKFGVLYFKGEENITEQELKALDEVNLKATDKRKTQSKKIREELWRCHQANNEGFEEFENYYKFATERIISELEAKRFL